MLPLVIGHFTMRECILLTALIFIKVCPIDFADASSCEVTYRGGVKDIYCRKMEHSELNTLNRTHQVLKYKCDGSDDVYKYCPRDFTFFKTFIITDCVLTPDTFCLCNYYRILKYLKSPGNYKNVVLRNGTFSNKHGVKIISLSGNGIESVESGAFDCLKDLFKLDLSNNSIEGLPDDAFRCLQGLSILSLSKNRISALPKSLRDLSSLTLLILSDNLITVFPEAALHERARLESLFLIRNRIKTFCTAEIRQLDDIDTLNLRGNNITSLPKNCFINQKELVSLDIGMNVGLVLENDSFAGLNGLSKLYMDGCKLSIGVELSTIFSDTTDLEILRLQHNYLREIHTDLFQNLRYLKYLDLSFNAISVLHNGSFANNDRLEHLDLSNNMLTEIKSGEFPRMQKLKFLSIRNNNITNVAENAFSDLRNLTELDISNNNISQTTEKSSVLRPTFQNIFRNLEHLEILNMRNATSSTSRDFYLIFSEKNKNIRYLDISFNVGLHLERNSLANLKNLRSFVSKSTNVESLTGLFTSKRDLEKIIMSGNKIQRIRASDLWDARNLRILDLSWNNISTIDADVFPFLKQIEYFNVSHNELQYMHIKDSFSGNRRLKVLDISSNRFTLIPLKDFTLVDTLWASNNSLKELILSESPMTSCQRVHLEDCKIQKVQIHSNLQMKNLSGICKTQFFLAKNPMVCDCRAFQLYEYVKHPTANTRFLFYGLTCRHPEELEGRKMENLLPEDFFCKINISCPETCLCLKRGQDDSIVVNCSRRNLGSLPEDVPTNTTILDVSYNNIMSLKSLSSSIWENLTEIHAEENSISSLEFEVPKNLKIVRLHRNNLTKLPENHPIVTRRALQITLSENPWSCGCETLTLKYALSQNRQILDASEVRCSPSTNSTRNLTLLKMKEQDLCPKIEKVYLKLYLERKKSVYISMIAVLSVLVFGLSVWLFYSKNENFVKAVIYTHCTCIVKLLGCRKVEEQNKIFDCFISYGSEDAIVARAIVRAMGEDPNPEFQFCVHDRNWRGGATISDNIFLSVEFSRKTLIVVSRTFVKSRWFYLEFQAALMQMLKDRRDRMIFVIRGDMPDFDDLPRDVRFFLRTRTYLVWGERWFMQKLRYSLQKEVVHFRVKLREFLLVVVNCFRIRRIYHRDLHEEIV